MAAPNQGDHVRLLIELLQPAGPDLARRWLAALLLVPREERETLVAEIEANITRVYCDGDEDNVLNIEPVSNTPIEVHVTGDAVQREGYVEQVTRTYSQTVGEDAQTASGSPSITKAKRSTRSRDVG